MGKTTTTQHGSRTGKALVILAGIAAILVSVPLALWAWFTLSIASGGVMEPGSGLFVCHSQGCVEDAAVQGLFSLGFVLMTGALVVLELWSTRRALAAALVLSAAATIGLLVASLVIGPRGNDSGLAAGVLVLATIPGAFFIGSGLRFRRTAVA